MSKVIMVGCRKGGVGKTTVAINVAYELSMLGKQVLLLDLDSQGDSTKYTGRLEEEFFIGDVLLDRNFDITKAIYPAIIAGNESKNLHVIAGRDGDAMTKLDMEMISLARREERLSIHLKAIKDTYDYVIIDTSPGTNVLGLNAVLAADSFLIPTEFKDHSLDGVATLLAHIEDVKFIDESEINFLVVPSKISKSSTDALTYGKAYLDASWPNNQAKTIIYERAVVVKAESAHEPVSVFAPNHVAASFYKSLALELTK